MANADDHPKDQPKLNEAESDQQKSAEHKQEAKEKKHTAKMTAIAETELEKLKTELAEYKDKYLRVLAESENARKRLQKERQELVQYSLQNLVADFLSPIDHFENALRFTEQASDEIKHWALGFQMILTQFKDVLSVNGVTAFESVGTHFDPHFHEAVEMVATDDSPPGTVVEESLRGYKMGDRVIRPARVKVAKSLSSEQPAELKGEESVNENAEDEVDNDPAKQKSL